MVASTFFARFCLPRDGFMIRLIIFTDLDGTLLDHKTYDYEPAREALDKIKALEIPLIFATSKTAAEVQSLFSDMTLRWPAIVENGSGVWCPEGRDPVVDKVRSGLPRSISYDQILAILDDLPSSLRDSFTGFSQFSVKEITDMTGLSATAAALAKARDYSEPGLWHGSEDGFDEFRSALSKAGLTVIKGGRFLHILQKTSKAKQMQLVTQAFRDSFPEDDVITAALGDAPNDREMLEAATHGFVIPNPSGTPLGELDGEKRGTILRVEDPGPTGWNGALLDLFARLNLTKET